MENKVKWVIVFERHHKYLLDKTSRIETTYKWWATIVWLWWKWEYIMDVHPVKQLSLLKIVDGVTYLDESRVIGLEQEQLRKLKCKKKSVLRSS